MTDRPTRILVNEDEPRIAQFLQKGLGRDGHEVIVAEDGEVGMFLVLHESFDAVVLDLTLPRRSGARGAARPPPAFAASATTDGVVT